MNCLKMLILGCFRPNIDSHFGVIRPEPSGADHQIMLLNIFPESPCSFCMIVLLAAHSAAAVGPVEFDHYSESTFGPVSVELCCWFDITYFRCLVLNLHIS